MTEPDIETVAEQLDERCDPVVGIRSEELDHVKGYDPADDVVQERVDGLFCADSIILRAKDIQLFLDIIGGVDELAEDVEVYVSERGSNPGSQNVWSTTLNVPEDSDLYEQLGDDEHGITSEIRSPIFRDDIIIDLRYW